MKIFTDQCGYFPKAEKKVRVTKEAKHFQLIDEENRVCLEGPLSYRGKDIESGDEIWEGDFTSFDLAGRYRIITDQPENGSSYSFDISSRVYDEAFRKLLKAFYFLRCGTALEGEWAEGFAHKACHRRDAIDWDNRAYSKDVTGGWHDAGDYGRYVTPGACALAHLLYAWQLYPEVFRDFKHQIPEDGGMLPSVLAECKVELLWLLKMQREDGALWHKVTTASHAPFVMPEEDLGELYLFAPSSMATADGAAIWALAYRLYLPFDPEFAGKMLSAARRAYDFLEAHPEMIGFRNPPGNFTGMYGEFTDRDNRYWAAAELYATTGEERFHKDFLALYQDGSLFCKPPWAKDMDLGEGFRCSVLTELGYGSVGGFGSFAYLLCSERERDSQVAEHLKKCFFAQAGSISLRCEQSGYGIGMKQQDYCWGSNMNLMKQGMTLAMANALSGTNRFSSDLVHYANYLFGENALGISYVSGVGEHAIAHPHLRPAFADGIEECIPGMVSGGPNKNPCENDRNYISFDPEQTPPMKCFEDLMECYSLNEITIYWNSPAVFVLAALMAEYAKE